MPPSKTKVILIADDLTGALDSVVAFAARGLRCIVSRDVAHLSAALEQGYDVVGVSTASRELRSDEATEILAQVQALIARHPAIKMKKIDSRLKGHIAEEVAALTADNEQPVFVSPALPRLGRFVHNGFLSGTAVETPICIAERIGTASVIPDVATLEALFQSLPDDLSKPLFVGAAGLAEALALRIVPSARAAVAVSMKRPLVMALGSRDPVTLAQIASIQMPVQPAPNGAFSSTGLVQDQVVQLVSGDVKTSPVEASQTFAQSIAKLVQGAHPASLLACGGETANAILASLGINLLEVLGEVRPGLPAALAIDGMLDLLVLTKSGGLGEVSDLQDLIENALP